jgi:hypothetical protein
LKDQDELESRLAALFGLREATGMWKGGFRHPFGAESVNTPSDASQEPE